MKKFILIPKLSPLWHYLRSLCQNTPRRRCPDGPRWQEKVIIGQQFPWIWIHWYKIEQLLLNISSLYLILLTTLSLVWIPLVISSSSDILLKLSRKWSDIVWDRSSKEYSFSWHNLISSKSFDNSPVTASPLKTDTPLVNT